jgi:hypothetical protein
MLSLELQKLTKHIVASEGGCYCRIHGGIPHDIACPPDVGVTTSPNLQEALFP